MTIHHPPRPWYCPDALVDTYKSIQSNGGDLRVIRLIKALKAIVTNILVVTIAIFSIMEGAEPTLVGMLALAAITLLNGIELSEWLAAKQALKELDFEAEALAPAEDNED